MGHAVTSLFSPGDEQLMWRVKLQDDPHAFARLVARWEKPVQRLCARMTGDAHRAEDLAQTAFIRVFSGRANWEPTARFSTFLWRIALNLCHDELRRLRRRGEFSLEVLEEAEGAEGFALDEPQPDVHAESQERSEMVRAALLALPAQYREVVVLRHYDGLKFREIAEVLAIPEGTVKSRMAEALEQLHRLLKRVTNDESCIQNLQTAEIRRR